MIAAQLAKITRPRTAALLPRLRLFHRLDQAGAKPLTWIWAQTGAGKTSLVVSYLAARPSRPLWYQVDASDVDLSSFFYYLGLAAPKQRQPMPRLTLEARQRLADFARIFFRTLFGRLKLPFTLVFDNSEEVPASSDFHRILPIAIAELPRHGRIICISGSEPPPSCARLHVDQAIEIIDNADLKFSEAETTLLANKLCGDRLPRAKTAEIHKISDGWAAAIVLCVRELRHRTTDGAPNAPTPELLFDYFAAQVFKQTDGPTQEVLRQTSFLPHITNDMAERLTGDAQAGLILANLQRQNFFTTKATAGVVTYQYHPLFRQFLLAQAEQFYDPKKQAAIRRKAAELLETAGQLEAATEHYRSLNDWGTFAALVCRQAKALLDQGRHQTVQRWLSAFPEPLFNDVPWLRFWRTQCGLRQHHAETFQDLQQCLKDFRAAHDHTGMFEAWCAIVAFIQRSARFALLEPWIAIIDNLIAEAEGFPSEDVERRVAIAVMSGIEMHQPNHAKASFWANRMRELCRGHFDDAGCVAGAGYCLLFHIHRGEADRAREIADELRATAKRPDIAPPVRLAILTHLSRYQYHLALPTHRRTIAEALELSAQITATTESKMTLLNLSAQSALDDGEVAAAKNHLAEMQRELTALTPEHACDYQGNLVRVCLAENDVQRALLQIPELLRLAELVGSPWLEATSLLLAAQTHFRAGAAEQAGAQLRRVQDIARSTASPYIAFPRSLLAAQFAFAAKREEEGLAVLRQALELGAQHNFTGASVWFPDVIAHLCVRALQENITVKYVRELVQHRHLVAAASPIELESWPWPVRIYTLGQFKIFKRDQPLKSGRKQQRKPLALLKAIIAHGGRDVRDEILIDWLWPDVDGDTNRESFNRTVSRLRKLLGDEAAILSEDNRLSLNDRHCWVDAFAVARLVETTSGNASQNTEQAMQLYAGPFLGSDTHIPAAFTFAERLRRGVLHSIKAAGGEHMLRQAHERALIFYERGMAIDPCAEDLCRRAMTIYSVLGRPKEVQAAYDRLKLALDERWQRQPSAETEELTRRLLAPPSREASRGLNTGTVENTAWQSRNRVGEEI